ncbi:SEC-C metal-binding domain-containing protein [Nitrosomonas sp.]|uniref:SEC-C metal-binding domain-containing protein n=1 Tax=Nitrosomonas sp. TaxID=42353 RepID=UPI001DDE5DA4|nr:SEC-C metal-binding domain-containing protein [Nitrosomonas sp.]MBX3618177.1 SEC-C domain-containing protein [Nitrosomonas sp.]
MKTGRNDPCPCGSGKKYKQCCLQAREVQQAEDFLWHQISRAIRGLPDRLLTFEQKRRKPGALQEAWSDFTLRRGEEFDPHSPQMQLFMPWFFHNWRADFATEDDDAPDIRTTGQAFLDHYGKQLEPLLKRYLEQCAATPFSFYEIISVHPGDGFILHDLLTDEECFVTERSGSAQAKTGQIVFGKLAKVDHVAILEACAPIFFPPIEKITILNFRQQLNELENPPTPALLKNYNHEMLALYHEISDRLLHPRIPKLCNTDGEPMVMQKLIYDIPSAQTAFAALKQLCPDSAEDELLSDADFAATGELLHIEFPWLKKDNTVLGNIRIKGCQLTTEVNSDKRAQRLRRLIKKLLPQAQYKTSVIESPQVMLAHMQDEGESVKTRQRREEQEELNNRPEVREKIMALMHEHYRQWPHEKLPALNGKTPLQTIKTKGGREMVEALLRDFELRNGDSNLPIDQSIFGELREQLGLKKPEK